MKKIILVSIFIFFYLMNIAQTKHIVKNINTLSFNLLKRINTENENTLISAYSISSALAMTYAGAKDSTKLEMEKILFPNVDKSVNKDFYDLNESLSFNKKLELYSANALWLENSYKLEKEYRKLISYDFKSEVNTANFSSEKGRKKARNEINSWVEKTTKGMISDFIAPNVLSNSTMLVLVNAIYYFSKWNIKFPKENTYKGIFKTSQKDSSSCDYMTDTSNYSYYTDNLLSAIEIPYENNEASMIILLPKNPSENLSESINSLYFRKIYSSFKKEKLELHLPKFKLKSEYELNKYLIEMGLASIFNSSADFSGITGSKELFISNVIHKAAIELNESGTKASAATAVVVSRSAIVGNATKPTLFKADHPFMFLIRENSTGTILFMGNLAKP